MSKLVYIRDFVYSQFFATPAVPTKSFVGQTVIVTGSNTGLGLEAARHLTRLGAAKVILAVRDVSKGEVAKASIEASTEREGVVEVWDLDLSSYESVKAFARRVNGELQRVDALLENAGMIRLKFEIVEEDESVVTINVVSTFLLALLLLPKLRETGRRSNTAPRLTIVGSDAYCIAAFPEKKAKRVFEALSDETKADMRDRYATSKLLQLLLVRQLNARIKPASGADMPIIVNTLTPGACKSDLFRKDLGFVLRTILLIFIALVGRTTEVGSRTLLAGASGGQETAGRYMRDGIVETESPFVRSIEGDQVGNKAWGELMEKLERISPGIGRNL